jgi:hypothetical protein
MLHDKDYWHYSLYSKAKKATVSNDLKKGKLKKVIEMSNLLIRRARAP